MKEEEEVGLMLTGKGMEKEVRGGGAEIKIQRVKRKFRFPELEFYEQFHILYKFHAPMKSGCIQLWLAML